MRVILDSLPGSLTSSSRSMLRVVDALRRYTPAGVKIVPPTEKADLQLIHTIGPVPSEAIVAPEFVVIQYCFKSCSNFDWNAFWKRSKFVWSYYDLNVPAGVRFLCTPLGVDGDVFTSAGQPRDIGCITSGFVSGPGAEAIEEVAEAAFRSGMSVFHLGPSTVVGMTHRTERSWSSSHGISDKNLARMYARSRWVSGLRHVEAFEFPVIEGLACGSRPIVFDRADMRRWYHDLAYFVPESSGQELRDTLQSLFRITPAALTEQERATVLERFSWQTIADNFWGEALR